MKRLARWVVVFALLSAGPAFAHEKGGRAMGVVQSVTPGRIAVRASDGHEVVFAVTPETRFVVGTKPARTGAARVGQRVVVHGKKVGDGLEAVEVRLGALRSSK